MLVKTILNRIQKQPGFVYGAVTLLDEKGHLVLGVDLWPRKRSRPVCSGCGKREGTLYMPSGQEEKNIMITSC